MLKWTAERRKRVDWECSAVWGCLQSLYHGLRKLSLKGGGLEMRCLATRSAGQLAV